jgi:hypothetical protein
VTIYTGEVTMSMPYVVDMDDEDEAEFEMLSMAKEDFPEANGFAVINIKKQN